MTVINQFITGQQLYVFINVSKDVAKSIEGNSSFRLLLCKKICIEEYRKYTNNTNAQKLGRKFTMKIKN